METAATPIMGPYDAVADGQRRARCIAADTRPQLNDLPAPFMAHDQGKLS
jgi:hypothetical protein